MTAPDQQTTGNRLTAFVYRLLPPRPTFMTTMSPEEGATMMAHAGYWTELMYQGKVVAFGPVADPREPYDIGIVLAEDLAEVQALRDQDPAVLSPHGLRAEISPLVRLVTPQGVYPTE